MLIGIERIPVDLTPKLGIRGTKETEILYHKIRNAAQRSRWKTGQSPLIVLVMEKHDGYRDEKICGNARYATLALMKYDGRACLKVWIEIRDVTGSGKL